MAGGLNLKVDIIQINYSSDDEVGGAIVTGTTAYRSVPARIAASRPSQASLEQGLEVNRIFDMALVGKCAENVNERDEVLVVWPEDHPYYNERFRIMGIQLDGRRPQYGQARYTLSRIERSRARQ